MRVSKQPKLVTGHSRNLSRNCLAVKPISTLLEKTSFLTNKTYLTNPLWNIHQRHTDPLVRLTLLIPCYYNLHETQFLPNHQRTLSNTVRSINGQREAIVSAGPTRLGFLPEWKSVGDLKPEKWPNIVSQPASSIIKLIYNSWGKDKINTWIFNDQCFYTFHHVHEWAHLLYELQSQFSISFAGTCFSNVMFLNDYIRINLNEWGVPIYLVFIVRTCGYAGDDRSTGLIQFSLKEGQLSAHYYNIRCIKKDATLKVVMKRNLCYSFYCLIRKKLCSNKIIDCQFFLYQWIHTAKCDIVFSFLMIALLIVGNHIKRRVP